VGGPLARQIMDLSTATDPRDRSGSCANSPVPIGTVPIYQALEKVNGDPTSCPGRSIGNTVIEQCEQAWTT